MSFKNLLYEVKEKAALITINRPEKLNALNTETIRELGVAVKQAEADAGVVAVIITGAGDKSFVAGADISEFNELDEQGGMKLARDGHDVFNSIESLSKPVIAAVNGFALGGGCELAMACHLRVASDTSMFGQPEVKLGLIPGYGGTQRLPRLIGRTKAMELLMTTDMIKGDEALQLGLVNYVTTTAEMIDKCFELVKKIGKQGPMAIKGVIASVNACDKDGVDGFETEITEFGKCFLTEDFKEGASAFMEKRKPEFKGK